MNKASTPVQSLSYEALLLRRRHLWANRAHLTDPKMREEFSTLQRINNKVEGYKWVRKMGHATVAYQIFPSIDAALQESSFGRFVVKPLAGHSSKGVHLLTRDGAGGYACTMTKRHFQSDDALIWLCCAKPVGFP
jgi:glutathione synthase/RimK-type ligase-like ATP-grasp enzyme